jgi:REP element-mobilizing transposase RayT
MKRKLRFRRSGQAYLAGLEWKKGEAFGGGRSHQNHPKQPRPFHSKADLHIVMRSEHATGKKSFLAHAKRVREITNSLAKRSFIELKDFANSGNHLHLIVRARSKPALTTFLKGLSGVLCRLVTGIQRGRAGEKRALGYSFWDGRPFSRILTTMEIFRAVKNYLELNRFEISAGLPRSLAREVLKDYKTAQQYYSSHLWT